MFKVSWDVPTFFHLQRQEVLEHGFWRLLFLNGLGFFFDKLLVYLGCKFGSFLI